jgi:hypothetical protein
MNQSLLSREEKDRYFVHFNVDGLMRGDYSSRMAGYATARQNGWMSANDIRRLEGMNDIPDDEGGNAYLVNGNMIPIKTALEMEPGNGGNSGSLALGGHLEKAADGENREKADS